MNLVAGCALTLLAAFGVLGVLFGMGLLVTPYRAVATMRGGGDSGISATN